MNISDEAVEAAAQSLWQVHPLTRENVRAAARRALWAAEYTNSPHLTTSNDEESK